MRTHHAEVRKLYHNVANHCKGFFQVACPNVLHGTLTLSFLKGRRKEKKMRREKKEKVGSSYSTVCNTVARRWKAKVTMLLPYLVWHHALHHPDVMVCGLLSI